MLIEKLEKRNPAFAFAFVLDSLDFDTGVRVDFEFDIDEDTNLVSLVDMSYAKFENGEPEPVYLREAGVDVTLDAVDADQAFEDYQAELIVTQAADDLSATFTQVTENSNVDLVLEGDQWDGTAGAVDGDILEFQLENEVVIGTSGIMNAKQAFLLEQSLNA